MMRGRLALWAVRSVHTEVKKPLTRLQPPVKQRTRPVPDPPPSPSLPVLRAAAPAGAAVYDGVEGRPSQLRRPLPSARKWWSLLRVRTMRGLMLRTPSATQVTGKGGGTGGDSKREL